MAFPVFAPDRRCIAERTLQPIFHASSRAITAYVPTNAPSPGPTSLVLLPYPRARNIFSTPQDLPLASSIFLRLYLPRLFQFRLKPSSLVYQVKQAINVDFNQ